MTYRSRTRALQKPIIGSLKSKMAEIRYLENRYDVIFSAEGGPIWIQFRRLVQNDMSTVVIWSKSKPDVKLQYGGRLGEFNGMSDCRVLPPGKFNVMILPLRVTFNDISSQSHVSHCRVVPLGEFTVMFPESHCMCSHLAKLV